MKLLTTLLGESAPQSPLSRHPTGPAQLNEAVRVRKLINESTGYLTLGPGEVRALQTLLKEGMSAVFVRGSFSTQDAEALGLDIDAENQEGGDEGSGTDPNQSLTNRSQDEYAGLLPAHLALTAPDLTPGHSSPIPTSMAHKLVGTPEVPQHQTAPPPQQHSAPAPSHQPSAAEEKAYLESRANAMLFGSGGAPPGGGGAPVQLSEDAGGIGHLAAGLSAMRRKKKVSPKGGSGGGRFPNTDEGRRLQEAANSRLSALGGSAEVD